MGFSTHSKKNGMNFIPIQCDLHLNKFHIYGINSVSMTFTLFAVRSSYCRCEKMFVIPKNLFWYAQ